MRDSTNVIRDQLSDVFDLIEVRGLLTGGLSVRGDWRATFDLAHPLKMVAVVCGRLRATADGCAPIELGPGDVAILNHRTTMTIEGGPRLGPPAELDIAVAEQAFARGEIECGEADVILGGHVDVNPIGEALLAQALPPVSHVRGRRTGAQPARDPRQGHRRSAGQQGRFRVRRAPAGPTSAAGSAARVHRPDRRDAAGLVTPAQ